SSNETSHATQTASSASFAPKQAILSTQKKAFNLLLFCTTLLSLLSIGCTQPYSYPIGAPPPAGYGMQPAVAPGAAPGVVPGATGPGSVFAGNQNHPQLVELQQRVKQLDENNRQLTTQIAQAQQQVQAYRERSELLAKQLDDTTKQNKQLLATTRQYADQALGMQASVSRMQESMQLRGGARLTANNSLNQQVQGLQITGAEVVQDRDVIRIRIQADQLFAAGTAQLTPSATMTLDQVSNALLRQYQRQRVAVEGHTDTTTAIGGYQTLYQMASAQAQAVIDHLVRRGGVPSRQLFLTAHGPNHPMSDNQSPAGRAQNRRIEIVVYPETF
ncbi:MAG: OmpA family protein, partial [Planctomycetota bacterium]